jgi:hypothetical protein
MSTYPKLNSDANGKEDLTPEEARKRREQFLALAREITEKEAGDGEEIDAADAALATLILPGG